MIFEIVCQKRSIWETQIKMLWTVGEEVRLNSKKDHYFKNKRETHSEIQLQGNTDFTTNIITKVQRQWDKNHRVLGCSAAEGKRTALPWPAEDRLLHCSINCVSLGFSRPSCGRPIQLSLATFSLLLMATFTISGMEVPDKNTENC